MADTTDTVIQQLLESNPLREPVLRSMVQALHLPESSHGLDAGCGIGLQAPLLAEAMGPSGHLTCFDLSPELLRFAEKRMQGTALAARVSFQQGDVSELPFDDQTFDWVWSVDCVGYPAGDLLPLLRELRRVVKPGGTIALMGWSSQCLLPGYPLLEAHLNAHGSQYAPYLRGRRPDSHFLRALEHFHDVGLEDAQARTFVGEVQAPLSAEIRTALTSLFQMLWGLPSAEMLSEEAWATYQRVRRPESPDFILDLPGYYAFFTYTMFRGVRPAPSVSAIRP